MGKSRIAKKIGILELQFIKNDDIGWCQTKHNTGMKRVASHMSYIMGQPAGYLCKVCAKEWENLWENIIGNI